MIRTVIIALFLSPMYLSPMSISPITDEEKMHYTYEHQLTIAIALEDLERITWLIVEKETRSVIYHENQHDPVEFAQLIGKSTEFCTWLEKLLEKAKSL